MSVPVCVKYDDGYAFLKLYDDEIGFTLKSDDGALVKIIEGGVEFNYGKLVQKFSFDKDEKIIKSRMNNLSHEVRKNDYGEPFILQKHFIIV